MNLLELAWKCTSDALMTLGEPTMQPLVWHANIGAPVAPEEFDIVKFKIALRDLVGGGADILVSIVADSLAAELKIETPFESELSAMGRIKQILDLGAKRKDSADAFDIGSARKNIFAMIAIAMAGMSLLVVLVDDEPRTFLQTGRQTSPQALQSGYRRRSLSARASVGCTTACASCDSCGPRAVARRRALVDLLPARAWN